ncbi:MAG: phosphoribosylformylglycinamidine synthase subunit PurQ [Alphaproteobacteria bacterium]|nr:MAG: phosphoribosylformylglycinamidine synthase subunit PurQ [Alphaproteobacteria bacterium]
MEKHIIPLKNAQPKFLVLAGDGVNCERETAAAFIHAGGAAEIVHINQLLENPAQLDSYDGMALPGGFSFGDELGSGQLLALKIRAQLGDVFRDFTAQKKPVIGICNGFQVLVRLGLLPFPNESRAAALAVNNHGEFMNKWADLESDSSSVCLWTKGMKDISLPVRHKEGRIVLTPGAEKQVYKTLVKNGQIPLRYATDINGSYERIAALCDPSGLILGMMPHPEAFIFQATNKTRHSNPLEKGAGLQLFENTLRYLKGEENDQEGLQRHGT